MGKQFSRAAFNDLAMHTLLTDRSILILKSLTRQRDIVMLNWRLGLLEIPSLFKKGKVIFLEILAERETLVILHYGREVRVANQLGKVHGET